MDAMKRRGVDNHILCHDGAPHIIEITHVTLNKLVWCLERPEIHQAGRVTGLNKRWCHDPAQITTGPCNKHVHNGICTS